MIINPAIGYFQLQAVVHDGNYYPSNIGLKPHEVYCIATGFMQADGVIPNSGICYEINNNLVPYDVSQSGNPRDINLQGHRITNHGNAIDNNDLVPKSQAIDLIGGETDWSEIGNPGDLLRISPTGQNIVGVPPSKVTGGALNALIFGLL